MKFIPIAEPLLAGNEFNYVKECFETNWISSLGKYIPEFETKFSQYCGTLEGISTCNGTAALHLALHTLGINENSEVLIPNLTFVATANSVLYCKAKPIFVEVEKDTWNMDPTKIEEKITPRTRAIIPVHLFGHPCDMTPIMEIAKKHGLYVIEDCAEAHGALYKNQKVGGFGDISCFSFYGNKTITTGEGGMCLTNNKELAKKMKFLRDHCMSPEKRYWHPFLGFNYRMTNIQAAIGLAQLETINLFLEKKKVNANLYSSLLKNNTQIQIPVEKEYAKHSYWMYSLLLNNSLNVNDIMAELKKKGIDSRPFFHPMSVLPAFRTENRFEISENIAKQGITLPSGVGLTKEQIEYICNSLNEIINKND